jgi:hypothetical protein
MDTNKNVLQRLNQGLTVVIGMLLLIAGGAGMYLYGPGAVQRGHSLAEYFRPPKHEPPKVVFEYKPLIPEGGYPVWNEKQWQGISQERMDEIGGIMAQNAARQAMQDAERAIRYSHGQLP